MRIRHDDADLEKIETAPDCAGGYSRAVVRGFRKALLIVRNAKNETELRNWRSLNFEKLKGGRSYQWSLRINDQFRIIAEIEQGEGRDNNCMVIKKIEDYH